MEMSVNFISHIWMLFSILNQKIQHLHTMKMQ
nr:MAG TPA: hypothetical protein [Bacteriophage sp.]